MRFEAVTRYAAKSVFRQKSRNAFIVFIVCLTSVFSLFTASLFEGKNAQVRQNIIDAETGHYQIIEKQFYLKSDPLHPLDLNDTLRAKVDGALFTPELLLKTTVLNPEGAAELTLLGIEPESHEKIFGLKNHVKGSWPLKSDDSREVVIGKNFSERMKLNIGDDLIITYQDRTEGIQTEALKVVGIFQNNGQGFERSFAYTHKNFIQNLLNLDGENPIHRLIIHAPERKIAPSDHDAYLLRTWRELHPELTVMMKFHDGITRTLIIFMLVIAFVSIITPVNVLWDERRGEVKLLQTIGSAEKTLYLMALVEAAVLTLFSLTFGTLIWGALHLLSSRYGLDFSLIGEKTVVRGGILISSLVYPVINWLHVVIIILFHAILIFICQLWCIRKVLKTEVLQ